MRRLAAPATRQARFVEEKTLAALTIPLRSEGRLIYARPGHLEKITETPTPETLVVDGTRLVVEGGSDPPRVFDLAGQPDALAIVDTIRAALSGDLPVLRRLYDVQGSGTLADWQLVLRPHDARLVREVRIAGGAEVRRIESIAPNGDTDTLTITPSSPPGRGPG